MSEILVPVSALLADARTAIEDFLSTSKNLVEKALTIGDRLVVLKQGVPHGDYSAHEKALADGYGLTTRTLRNYRAAAIAVAEGHSTREEAIALGLKGVLAAWRGQALPPPETEPEPAGLETVSSLPKPKPKTASTIATLQTENDALKADKAMLEARLATLAVGDATSQVPAPNDTPPETPANDAEKPADADDEASDIEDRSDEEDASADGVKASEGAGDDDDGGGAKGVGGAANEPNYRINQARIILIKGLTDSRNKQMADRTALEKRVVNAGAKAQLFDRLRLAMFQALDVLN